MNRKQDRVNNMLLVVRDFLLANVSITAKLPNFTVFFTALLNAIALIQKYSTQQLVDRSGIYQGKIQLRKKLIDFAIDVSRKFQAYAEFINDAILEAETKFTETELNDAADNKLRDISQGLYDKVQINLTALALYGLTEETQTAFLAAINEFNAAIPKPKLGSTIKKQDTSELKNAFIAAQNALDKIDTVIEIVHQTEPIFYLGYKSASKILYGNSSISLKGSATDASTGLPLKGVIFSFLPDDGSLSLTNGKPVLVKKSAEKGGFYVKSMPAGMYKVSLKKNGYVDQVLTIAISDGETTSLKIEMKKI